MIKHAKSIAIESIKIFIISYIVLGPITGLVLDGFEIEMDWQRPLLLAAGLTLFAGCLQAIKKIISTHKPAWLSKEASVTVKPAYHLRWWQYSLILTGLVILPFLLKWTIGNYGLAVVIVAMIYVLLGLGLNIVVGLAGLLDLGFVAFYAVGAYTYALGGEYLGLGFWLALPLGACLAGFFGMLLGFPVLKMHGDYLAIVTLGFGEIIRLVLNNWAEVTNGPNGIFTQKPTFFGLQFVRRAKENGVTFHEFFNLSYSSSYKYFFMYFVALILVLLVIVLVERLKTIRLGRAWEALREDEIACRSLGINPVTTKLSAFSMGAFIGGIGGVLFAAHQNFVNPASFTFIESAIILAIVVLGGMGSTWGVILAALVLTITPEVLREFSDYRMLVFGLLMVVMMIWRPRGLMRIKRLKLTRPTG